jgi:hypothetical protein
MRIATIVATVVVASIIAGRLVYRQTKQTSADPDGYYLGVQPDHDSVIRTGLAIIYSDVIRDTNTAKFEVRWSASRLAWLHLEDETDRLYLTYERQDQKLFYGSNGGEGGWDRVSVPMLQRASLASDPWLALKQYGCTSFP